MVTARGKTCHYTHHNSLILFRLWQACDNEKISGASTVNLMIHLSQTRRALIWAAMAVIVALLCFVGFRGYLSTEMLLNFANAFYC